MANELQPGTDRDAKQRAVAEFNEQVDTQMNIGFGGSFIFGMLGLAGIALLPLLVARMLDDTNKELGVLLIFVVVIIYASIIFTPLFLIKGLKALVHYHASLHPGYFKDDERQSEASPEEQMEQARQAQSPYFG